MNVTAMTNRVIVFRATKRFMEEMGRCPSQKELLDEVGGIIDVSKKHLGRILTELNGADGLLYPTTDGSKRDHVCSGDYIGDRMSAIRAIKNHDETSCPVDILMQG